MPSHDTLTLAALQIEPSTNITDTLLQIKVLLKNALEKEVIDCVVLPEYAFGTFREWASSKQDSARIRESIQTAMQQLAAKYNVAIVAGSMPYQTTGGQWRNRSIVVSMSGRILGSYDKHYPFRAEKRLGLEAGTELPIFKLKGLHMAVLICSDLWYHELIAQVASRIDFLAVPTMTTVLDKQHIHYGQWTWQSLVSVRAKEYTVPIASADQAFREYAPGVYTCGGSCIADPSYRFSTDEGYTTQALRIAPTNASHSIISRMSLKQIKDYAAYRRDVGLRE